MGNGCGVWCGWCWCLEGVNEGGRRVVGVMGGMDVGVLMMCFFGLRRKEWDGCCGSV